MVRSRKGSASAIPLNQERRGPKWWDSGLLWVAQHLQDGEDGEDASWFPELLIGVLRSNNAEDARVDQLEKALEEDGAHEALGQAIEAALTQEGLPARKGDADDYEAPSVLAGEYSSYPSGEGWHYTNGLARSTHPVLQVGLPDEYAETSAGKLIVALLRTISKNDFVTLWRAAKQ